MNSSILSIPSIPLTQHTVITGRTGTGKTTLAKYLLLQRIKAGRRMLFVDPKADFNAYSLYQGLKRKPILTTRPDDTVKFLRKGSDVLYRPHPDHLEKDSYNRVFEEVFWQGDMSVFYDEGSLVCNAPNSFPTYFRALYQQGRSRGIDNTLLTQRPTGIPLFCFTECSHFISFRLVHDDDIKRMSQWMRVSRLEYPADRHGFWYFNEDLDSPVSGLLRFK